ncbi:MAG: FAD-dependent thymidylate synthase [Oscillospiraceae bacterium]|nr:FAD-dependent thymidylate synthase [Oscillospiraceae bacterium]
MNQASVKIIASSTAGDTICAAAGRISTTQGTALEIYERSREKENNSSLIEKVCASGHTSTLEHQFFTVAFDNVSVCTEEFVIEFRLGSYTVQSRRYVDFAHAGFCIPPMPEELLPEYKAHMQSLFDAYSELLSLDIPKEDARYLLPYCFRSNFFCTMNARELLYMIHVMTQGRGAAFPELKQLGESLLEQIRRSFPNLPDILSRRLPKTAAPVLPDVPEIGDPSVFQAAIKTDTPSQNAAEILREAAQFNWTVLPEAVDIPAIIRSGRARELEMLHVQFTLKDLSLAAITHLVRHRIQTVLVPQVTQAALRQHYVLPETIRANPSAAAIYQKAFTETAVVLRKLCSAGLPAEAVQYFALAGNQLDVRCDMNGRELLHFMKLRTCNRAQWEIRACTVELLRTLRADCPEVYGYFGPSCFVSGGCPEGRLSCGKSAEVVARFSTQDISDSE